MDQRFDVPVDAAQELESLLERSGAEFHREGERFRLLFAAGGCRWQVVCQCRGDLAMVYHIHPARVEDPARALELCSSLNGRVIRGSFFLQEERFVFRDGAELTEHWEAQDRLARALEYGAAVMPRFWQALSAAAGGTLLEIE